MRVHKELDHDLTESEIESLRVVMNEAHVALCNIILVAAGFNSLKRQKELGLLAQKIVSK